jgi:hypothetical protein
LESGYFKEKQKNSTTTKNWILALIENGIARTTKP